MSLVTGSGLVLNGDLWWGVSSRKLLEIRLYIKSINAVVSDFQGTFPVATPSATLDVLNSLNEIVPADPDLRDRYNTALTELASTHPVLAYKLRRKDQISAFLNRLRSIQPPSQSEIDVLVRMHEWLRSEITESVEEAIRQVAWAHGIRTWYSTRRILRRKGRIANRLLRTRSQI